MEGKKRIKKRKGKLTGSTAIPVDRIGGAGTGVPTSSSESEISITAPRTEAGIVIP
jgi:hypothetical protein